VIDRDIEDATDEKSSRDILRGGYRLKRLPKEMQYCYKSLKTYFKNTTKIIQDHWNPTKCCSQSTIKIRGLRPTS